jgi:hypothetical protein
MNQPSDPRSAAVLRCVGRSLWYANDLRRAGWNAQ